MTHPDRDLEDVSAHLEALFLITDASRGDMEAITSRLAITAHRDNTPAVMRYLATYAAALARRLREHQALPSEPPEFLSDIAHLVAASVPRPE